MLSHSLEIIKLRLKRGEDLSAVQTLLELVDRVPFEVKVKPTQLKNAEPFDLISDLSDLDAMKGLKIIRVNSIAGKNSVSAVNQNFELAGNNGSLFDLNQLRTFLAKYSNQYPDEYRSQIWIYLMSLPSNFIQYNSYIQKGVNKHLENFD